MTIKAITVTLDMADADPGFPVEQYQEEIIRRVAADYPEAEIEIWSGLQNIDIETVGDDEYGHERDDAWQNVNGILLDAVPE